MHRITGPEVSALRPPEVPKFPFSSPITEEVLSPASSSEGNNLDDETILEIATARIQYQPFRRMDQDGRWLPRYDDPSRVRLDARRFSGREQAKRRSIHGIMKKRPPLHLVTNFSRNEPRRQGEPFAAPFVDLNDLKSLVKAREKERSNDTSATDRMAAREKERSYEKLKRAIKRKPTQGYQALADEHTPADTGSVKAPSEQKDILSIPQQPLQLPSYEKYELSPSDRPIVIGLMLPFEETISRDGSEDSAAKENGTAQSHQTPVTPPSIVITPANEDSPWEQDITLYHRPPRATSSVYSRPALNVDQSDQKQDIPPVPAIPAIHSLVKGEAVGTVLTKQPPTPPPPPLPPAAAATRKQRSFSTGTVFEDEDDCSQSVTRERSNSTGSSRWILPRLSTHADLNRHQSQGWWTYLLSPLLGRSNTNASRKSVPATEPPPVPPFSTASLVSKASSDRWWEKETSHFSPETPALPTGKTDGVITWPENYERAVSGFTLEKNFGVANDSSAFSGQETQGLAAEYYQACAHDLFNDKPYFECINHVCSMTPPSQENAALVAGDVNRDGERGLPPIENNEPEPSQQPVLNRNNPFLGVIRRSNPEVHTPVIETVPESTPSVREMPVPISVSPSRTAASSVSAPRTAAGDSRAVMVNQPIVPTSITNDSEAPPSLEQEEPRSLTEPPPYSPPETSQPAPRYRVIMPPNYTQQPQSPGPISPGMQQAMAGRGLIPMSEMQQSQPQHSPVFHPNVYQPPPHPDPFPAARSNVEAQRRRLEREDAVAKKVGGLWRGRGPFSNKGCFGRPGREGRVRRRWYFAISCLCLIIIIVAIALATTLRRKGDETPVQSQWLNLTGYPPMPTGIMTVAGPVAQTQNNGCIQPSSLWSCALPREQQSMNAPFPANQPNFRVQIRFQNGTYPNSTVIASGSTSLSRRRTGNAVTAGRVTKDRLLRARDLFSSSPAPPGLDDQTFLGNTTDGNAIPFAGEETPFFLTFLSPVEVAGSQSVKRANDHTFPNLTALIPDPSNAPDGTAAPADLYPLPVSQPVRLYNRGLPNEHYGFYVYFDRSIFLKSIASLNNSAVDDGSTDQNGGSPKTDAKSRCTWAQTRFLVQIWTQPSNRSGMALLGSTTAIPTRASPTAATPTGTAMNTTSSSANDFTVPGSFPYPVSIKLDRHGGDAKEKLVYCYGMDANQRINSTDKKIQIEDRSFGGQLINPAPGIFNDASSTQAASVFDGGTGGCSCEWVNWILTS
ncbi:hypothetical protein Egran_03609 [Elaphomyces granulatus]|uniref:Glycoprotease family protein n=1 Tax=Elaphomyces granulatus TaxID=519963 RepID=A0A232LWU0_9EURO|nr:hypothetical protein Egran_03609 [Elaphomyces granulatus]